MNRLKQHVAAKMPMPADGDVRSYQSALARETRATLRALREGQLRPSRRKVNDPRLIPILEIQSELGCSS